MEMNDGFIFETPDDALMHCAKNAIINMLYQNTGTFELPPRHDDPFYIESRVQVVPPDCKMTVFEKGKFVERFPSFEIDRVIFNDPATIVYWKDGTKTVVKCQKEHVPLCEALGGMFFLNRQDDFDPVKGLALCFMKKACGNKGNYNDVFRRWVD